MDIFWNNTDRIVKNWGAIKKHFLEEITKLATQEKAFKALEMNEWYTHICRKLQDRFLPAQ